MMCELGGDSGVVVSGQVVFQVGEGDHQKVYTFQKQTISRTSDVFQVMFNFRWDGHGTSTTVHLPTVPIHIFERFLLYLLNEQILDNSMDVEDLLDVFQLADYYGVLGLRKTCKELLLDKMKKMTLAKCVEICHEIRLYEDIRIQILTFLCSKLKPLVETSAFLTLEEEDVRFLLQNDNVNIREIDLFKALLRWGNAADSSLQNSDTEESRTCCRSRKDATKRLSSCLRLGLLSASQLINQVVPTQFLSLAEANEVIQFQNGMGEGSEKLRGMLRLRCGNEGELKLFPVDVERPWQCFNSNYGVLMKVDPPNLTLVPQIRFKTDSLVYIRGVTFYGNVLRLTDRSSWNLKVGFSISRLKEPTSETIDAKNTCGIEKIVRFTGPKENKTKPFELLLEKPFKVNAGVPYYIRAGFFLDEIEDLGFVSHGARRRTDDVYVHKTSGLEKFRLAHDNTCKEMFECCGSYIRSTGYEQAFQEDDDGKVNHTQGKGRRGKTYRAQCGQGNNLGQKLRVGIVHSILFTSA